MEKKVIFRISMFVLPVIILCFALLNQAGGAIPVLLTIKSGTEAERIHCWKDEQGDFFAFLPGYARLDEVYLRIDSDAAILLGGGAAYDGMPCGGFAFDVPYALEYSAWGKKKSSHITFVQSGGVAAMFLDTASGSMAYIHENKENKESGSARLYEKNGSLNCNAEQLTVKGRGNATWTDYDKRPYAISLTEEADLLGMGSAQNWVLLANSADHSHMRNKIVYDFAAQIGLPYSPDCRWVDLYLNGEYSGLYLLSEKNEVHPQRINLTEEKAILVSIEPADRMEEQKLSHIQTDSAKALRVHYPSSPGSDTLTLMENQWQCMENAIMSENGIDPVSGKAFAEMADMHSWVQNYLIDEIFGNLDGFAASRYFYYENSGEPTIYAGPVWDYDKALGNDTDLGWSITNPRNQVVPRYAHNPESIHKWGEELYEKDWFQTELRKEFGAVMCPALDQLLNSKIDAYASLIRPAAQMDRIRWLSTEEGSFDQAVSQLTEYLKGHTEFLKEIWLEGKQYCQVGFLGNGCDQFCAVENGGLLIEIPAVENRPGREFLGWYYVDTNEPFDITKPITEDIEIYAKWNDTPSKTLGQIAKLTPLMIIAVMGFALLAADIRKNRRK